MRILIVDDESVSQTKLRLLLASHGECEMATGVAEAVVAFDQALAEKRPYDLITMDVELPDDDGPSAVAIIRTREKTRDVARPVCIIMVTLRNDSTTIVEAVNAGCNGYLTKPFSGDRVRKELARLGLIPV